MKQKYPLCSLSEVQLMSIDYSELPEQEAGPTQWDKVVIDLIGPWKVKLSDIAYEFNVLTYINMTTNLVELVCIDNRTSNLVW